MITSNLTATYHEQSSAKGWLKKVVGNALRNDCTARDINRPTHTVAPAGSRVEEMTHLLKSIGSIYSTPYLLFYKGYDYREIAAQLNLPVGTVKSRVFSARVKMKQAFAQRKSA